MELNEFMKAYGAWKLSLKANVQMMYQSLFKDKDLSKQNLSVREERVHNEKEYAIFKAVMAYWQDVELTKEQMNECMTQFNLVKVQVLGEMLAKHNQSKPTLLSKVKELVHCF